MQESGYNKLDFSNFGRDDARHGGAEISTRFFADETGFAESPQLKNMISQIKALQYSLETTKEKLLHLKDSDDRESYNFYKEQKEGFLDDLDNAILDLKEQFPDFYQSVFLQNNPNLN